jgi:exosortase
LWFPSILVPLAHQVIARLLPFPKLLVHNNMSRKDKTKLAKIARHAERSIEVEPGKSGASTGKSPSVPANWLWTVVALLLPITLWAYWPTLVWMEDQWRNEPDYSHGYLVIPLALLMLHYRRDKFPGIAAGISWGGISLLIIAIALRIVGRFAYMDFLDGWTLVPWVAGVVWLFCGLRVLRWALPAVLFLLLLVPMPYRAESMLSTKLQTFATTLSVGALRVIGLPAIPEGNTIWLEDQQMMVEEACSGLRIFVGMAAMGFFVAVLAQRLWIDRLVILASALPIAIAVNVFRVAATVMALHFLPKSVAGLAHDLLGFAMIALGAGLLFAVKYYWEHLYREVDSFIAPVIIRSEE